MFEIYKDPELYVFTYKLKEVARNIYRSREVARVDIGANCRLLYTNSTNSDYFKH